MTRSTAATVSDPVPPEPGIEKAAADRMVEVEDLTVRFVSRDLDVSVINGVSFTLAKGEVLCFLGESGSGKSVTLRALMRLLPPTARIAGRMLVDGRDVAALSDGAMQAMRGEDVAMIFQEPMTALDPVFTIGQQIGEMIVAHKGVGWGAAEKRALELLELVQIPSAKRRLAAYPHELSGGLRQRAMIALALSCSPKLLLADEPTTALDATVQIQVLLLLRELQQELGMATIFVTHDLGVAAEIADRIGVMYAGRLVELGDVSDIIERPKHPYTEGLMRSTVHGGMRGQVLDAIPGSPPDLSHLPPGCSFAPRCPQVRQICLADVPRQLAVGPGHTVRCNRHLPHGAFLASAELPE
jgi:peptide/nickel transport system ATP-binding protein